MFNVLIVDDSSMDIILLTEIIKSALPFGKMIDTYTDAQQAIDRWNTHQYDLIVTDVEMPNIDGFDLIEHVKNRDKQTIIAVSGSIADESLNETILYAANAYGADFTVSKENLFENLTKLLQIHYLAYQA